MQLLLNFQIQRMQASFLKYMTREEMLEQLERRTKSHFKVFLYLHTSPHDDEHVTISLKITVKYVDC